MTLLVQLERSLPATPERVYDAWLNPQAMAQFLCPAPGVQLEDVSVDPRVGGAFSLTMVVGEARVPIEGDYRVMQRPHALHFGWRSHRTTADSEVQLTFAPQGDHTLMTLRHVGFTDASSRADHHGGWQHILELLAKALG